MELSKNWGSTTVWVGGVAGLACATILAFMGKITSEQWTTIAQFSIGGVSAKGIAAELGGLLKKKNGAPPVP